MPGTVLGTESLMESRTDVVSALMEYEGGETLPKWTRICMTYLWIVIDANGGKEQEAVRIRKVGRGDFGLGAQGGPVWGNGHWWNCLEMSCWYWRKRRMEELYRLNNRLRSLEMGLSALNARSMEILVINNKSSYYFLVNHYNSGI